MSAPDTEFVPLPWLKAHEEYVEARVAELVERFRATGCVDYAVVADRRTGTVVDGHHRLEALRRLGAKLVPTVLVDYQNEEVAVANWREDDPPVTKEEVILRALHGPLFPPKTTRHDFVRVLGAVDVPLSKLTDAERATTPGKA